MLKGLFETQIATEKETFMCYDWEKLPMYKNKKHAGRSGNMMSSTTKKEKVEPTNANDKSGFTNAFTAGGDDSRVMNKKWSSPHSPRQVSKVVLLSIYEISTLALGPANSTTMRLPISWWWKVCTVSDRTPLKSWSYKWRTVNVGRIPRALLWCSHNDYKNYQVLRTSPPSLMRNSMISMRSLMIPSEYRWEFYPFRVNNFFDKK